MWRAPALAKDLGQPCLWMQLAAVAAYSHSLASALYSLHDALSGEVLAVLAAPAFLRARRVAGAVESRPRSEVRGWVLDSERPERVRKVAVHVDGCLREVIDADDSAW